MSKLKFHESAKIYRLSERATTHVRSHRAPNIYGAQSCLGSLAIKAGSRTAQFAWSRTTQARPLEPESNTATGNHEHLDVLLIEDSPSDAWLVDQQLREGSGDAMHVTTVTNLAEALRVAASHHFDAALLDLNLPDSQGLATFEEFHSATPELPLIVLSGVANAEVALAVLRKGAQDCLLKLEVPGALLDRVIRLAIERRRISRELDDRFAQLKQSEIRIRETIEGSGEAFIALDDRGIVTFANDAAATMLNHKIDELRRKPFAWSVPALGTVDVAIRRADGTPGLGEMRSIGPTTGSSSGMLLSLRDVTERRRADAATRDSEYRLRMLLEHSVDSILLIDAQGSVKYASPSVGKVTGYSVEEWRDVDGLCFLFADDMENHLRLLDELKAQPRASQKVKWRFRHKHGRILHFEGVTTNLLDAPAIGGLVINFSDVTERYRIEETQRQAQKLEALGTLAGGIAHDFNNILLAIVGNTRLAIADLPGDHPARRSLAEVEKASHRAADLVRRILSFSRADKSQRQVVDLFEVIGEVVPLLRATLPAAVQVNIKSKHSAPRVLADLTQVHQVILNLATNAAHAIVGHTEGSSGRIDITLDDVVLDSETAASIGEIPAGWYARVSVMDNGCGIDAEVLPRIFEPFFTTKSQGQGTGLGLSMAHGIMREHNGAIGVYSESGKGSVFNLYFPATTEIAEVREHKQAEAPLGNGERILYVDDDEALVFLAERTLAQLGYDVRTYTDPSKALLEFKQHAAEYGAVVTDLSMVGMSGFQLAEAIRAIEVTIPIIITSGYVRQEDRERAAQLNIAELILKPNTVEALGTALHRCLQQKLSC
ncbi:MAG TPA: response regulator [Steroidobacteraceae bacterium]|nr:response regulator [Steroidobacteraceae bacterium]